MFRLTSKPVLLSLIATTAGLVGGACSHEQKITKVESAPIVQAQPQRAPAPAPARPSVAAAQQPPEDKAIFFDFDSALLRTEARPVLQKVASEVSGKDRGELRVEGNCDELGTVEYNLALGDSRARAAKEYLVHLGVSPSRIQTVSYGSQRPRFAGHDDDARAKNRRDDFVLR